DRRGGGRGARARGKGGASVARASPGRQPPRGRPPPAVPHRLHGAHVHRVDVGPLLAIDLDGDVVLVQIRRDLLVLERLLRHHVAPVAGRVADAEQDRPLLVPRPGEGLVAPRIPVDGVVGVLAEGRAGAAGAAGWGGRRAGGGGGGGGVGRAVRGRGCDGGRARPQWSAGPARMAGAR